MPRVPDIPLASVPRQAGVPQVAQPRVAGEAAQALGRAAQVVFEFGERQKRARDRNTLAASVGSLAQGLDQIRQSALELEDPTKMTELYDAESQQLIETLAGQIEDDAVRGEFEIRAIGLRAPDRSSVASAAFKLEKANGQATLNNSLVALQRKAGTADNDILRERAVSEALLMIDESEYLSDPDKEEARQKFLAGVDSSAVSSLMERALSTDSFVEKRQLMDAAERLLDDRESTPNMDPDTRLVLQRSLITERNRAKTLQEERIKKNSDRIENGWLERLTDPNQENPLTGPEIAATEGVDPTIKRIYINAVDSKAAGTQFKGNPAAFNRAYRDIYDPDGPQITADQITAQVGLPNGLDVGQAKALRAELDKVEEAPAKAARKTFDQIVQNARRVITNQGLFSIEIDGAKEEAYSGFLAEVGLMWDEAIAAGENPRLTILNPEHERYIGNIALRYRDQALQESARQTIDRVEKGEGIESPTVRSIQEFTRERFEKIRKRRAAEIRGGKKATTKDMFEDLQKLGSGGFSE